MNRRVLDREQHRVLVAIVAVLVPRPLRDDQIVATLPLEASTVDHRVSAALVHVIDRAAGMTMRPGVRTWRERLYPAVDRRQHRPAGVRMKVLKRDAVKRTTVYAAHRSKC